MNKPILAAFALALFAAVASADTVIINFERTDNPRALPGAEATNLYLGQGVRFPSRPTIEHDGRNQILQQGRAGTRPDPLPDRITCAPIEMEFSLASNIREVRMRVINRHLRSYSVQAFSDTTEVDVNRFNTTPPSGPPFPPLLPYRDITLRSGDGEGSINRVVVNPPSDCFDLAVIDNLVLVSDSAIVALSPVPDPPRRNTITLTAYEITQGVMSRLTWPTIPGTSFPDRRIMALPDRSLRFVEGRDTAARFFFNSNFTRERNYDATLTVTVTYRDGTRRTKAVTENTEGGREAPVTPAGGEATRRHAIVKRRANVDQSLDYVIPGRFLENAQSARLALTTITTGTPIITIAINFDGPYRLGLNLARVNGVGMDAAIGPAPSRVTSNLATQFVEEVFPITGFIRVNESGVLTMNTGQSGGCFPFLAALDAAVAGTSAGAPVSGVNYWSNVYMATNTPPDCGGLGWYNRPGALVNTSYSTLTHEVSHNAGINHATNLHGEDGGGAGDWEPWPYTHGSIGAVDETSNWNDGVFGASMILNSTSSGVDRITNWGTWILVPLAPCMSAVDATLFPNCTAGDASIRHDYMSYSGGARMPIWGVQNWVSDVNYLRLEQFFEECIAIDPPHRFWVGRTGNFTDTSGACTPASSLALLAATEASRPGDALVFTGTVSDKGAVSNFSALRKIAEPYSFANLPGPYTLVMRAADGSVLKSIPFELKTPEGDQPGGTIVVVAPYESKLATVEVMFEQKLVFAAGVSGQSPGIALVSPKPNEVWQGGKHRIEWKTGQAKTVYVQYSPDKGNTWYPLAVVNGGESFVDVDTADLRPSAAALIYVSATTGLDTGFDVMPGPFTISQQ